MESLIGVNERMKGKVVVRLKLVQRSSCDDRVSEQTRTPVIFRQLFKKLWAVEPLAWSVGWLHRIGLSY